MIRLPSLPPGDVTEAADEDLLLGALQHTVRTIENRDISTVVPGRCACCPWHVASAASFPGALQCLHLLRHTCCRHAATVCQTHQCQVHGMLDGVEAKPVEPRPLDLSCQGEGLEEVEGHGGDTAVQGALTTATDCRGLKPTRRG